MSQRGTKQKLLRWGADRISNTPGYRFRLPDFLLKKSTAGEKIEDFKVKISEKWDNFLKYAGVMLRLAISM